MTVVKATSFCEQKDGAAPRGAKKLFYSSGRGVAAALPHHRTRVKKVFGCFFQKALLPF
jgi:hypothetical protein